MVMSRDVWRSTPNVISHLEKEAEKHLLDDKTRKVGHVLLPRVLVC